MAHKTKGLRIATRCTTMDQFVAAFHRFVDAQTVFISTLNPRTVGLETAFSIDLADNTPALRGVGVVIESWTSPQNPYGRPGLQLGIRRLTVDSEPVFDRLLFAREATAATPTPTSSIMPVVVIAKRPLAKTLPTPLGVKQVSSPPGEEIPVTTQPMPVVADGERTPGSDLVLPANPLMNIDDKSLEGFVDCTIYEETGNFFGEQPVVEDPEDPAIAPPLLAPRRNTSPIPIAKPDVVVPSLPPLMKPQPVINKLTPPMGASAHVQPAQFTLPMFGKGVAPTNRVIPIETLNTATAIAQQMAPPPAPPPGPPPIPSKPWVSAETAEMLDLDPEPVSIDAAPPFGAAASPSKAGLASYGAPPFGGAASPSKAGLASVQPLPQEYSEQTYPSYDQRAHAGSYDAPPPQQHISSSFPVQTYRAQTMLANRRRWVIGISAGATVTIAIALVAASHSSTKTATAATPSPTLVASASNRMHLATPDVKPVDPPVTDTSPTTDTEPPGEDTGGVVGKGPCKIAISTTPAGSMITVDGEAVGPSPLTVAGKCEKRRIDVAHPRYAPAERIMTPKAEDTLDITLMRPTHDLFVETQPGGAIVMIDGHRAGTTPTMVKVMGFTTLTLTIEKPGYKPTTKKLYSKSAIDRMSVKLAH